ncbi:unnamed protein product [Cuscuta campestris]|uniref:Uncharacterized protein n=1 Tax=Cuscuta campestris TaxID=132261 RepID=A0A484N7I3_9ASTE|nr:unnamed protein product [Cuscuta campestris]
MEDGNGWLIGEAWVTAEFRDGNRWNWTENGDGLKNTDKDPAIAGEETTTDQKGSQNPKTPASMGLLV